ncbi:MAG: hypothetical protein P1U65_01190 [Minwuia sp.]|nr:hypothetical protein [Minwuia sp.]
MASRIALEQLGDHGRHGRVRFDDFLAVLGRDIEIAHRRLRWPDALLGLLHLPLARLFGEVVDIVLGHQHLDAVHELFRRARIAREYCALLGEVDFYIQLVERHPILEIAIKPVGLFHQNYPHAGMLAQISDHLIEIGAAGALGGLNIDIFLGDSEAILRCIIAQQFALRRNGEAFSLLFLGGYPRIKQRLDGLALFG